MESQSETLCLLNARLGCLAPLLEHIARALLVACWLDVPFGNLTFRVSFWTPPFAGTQAAIPQRFSLALAAGVFLPLPLLLCNCHAEQQLLSTASLYILARCNSHSSTLGPPHPLPHLLLHPLLHLSSVDPSPLRVLLNPSLSSSFPPFVPLSLAILEFPTGSYSQQPRQDCRRSSSPA